MSEQPQNEVGAAMWGPKAPLRRRPLEVAEQPEGRTIDVRDAAAVALILTGGVSAVAFIVALWGWLAVGLAASLVVVAGGVALGFGER